MSFYTDIKYAASDAVCAAFVPLSPEAFSRYCSRFIDGFFVTLELLILSCVIGFLVAILIIFARLSSNSIFSNLAFGYSYLFRGTPLLVQLWLLYFGVGSLGADRLGALWPFFREGWNVGLLVLILNTSAYVSEVLRGGLVNIPKGQMEAAMALGIPWLSAMRRIMFPQALRIAWPAYSNEVILLMKGSALVSTITVLDLMGQTRTVFSRSYNLEIYGYAAILYLIIAGLITLLFKVAETRIRHA